MAAPTINLPHDSAVTHTNGTASGVAGDKLAAATARRCYLFIQNLSSTSGEDIHVAFGATATTSHPVIAPGEAWESPAHWCPQEAVNLISAAGTPKYAIMSAGSGGQ